MRLERPSVRAGQGVAGGDQRAARPAPGATQETESPRPVGGEVPLGADAVDLAIELGLVKGGGLMVVRHVMSPSVVGRRSLESDADAVLFVVDGQERSRPTFGKGLA